MYLSGWWCVLSSFTGFSNIGTRWKLRLDEPDRQSGCAQQVVAFVLRITFNIRGRRNAYLRLLGTQQGRYVRREFLT